MTNHVRSDWVIGERRSRVFEASAGGLVQQSQQRRVLPLYGQILAGLDPQRTYDELVALMAPAEPVLLCYEVPPFTAPQPIPQAGLTTIGRQNLCHRRLVAMWFQEILGIEVTELELPHGSLAATRHARGPAIPREPPSHVDIGVRHH